MNVMSPKKPVDPAWQLRTLAASAKALDKSGDTAGAGEIYKRVLELAPFNGPALSFHARQAHEAGEFERALALLDKAIQGNPRNARHYNNRAQVYLSLGRLEDAVKDLERVLEVMPGFATALFQKALLLRDLGQRDEAVREAVRAWRQHPDVEQTANLESAPESIRAIIKECADLLRATQLVMIDSELESVIEQFGKESLRRVFDSVAAFSGLGDRPNTGHGASAGLCVPGLTEVSASPSWAWANISAEDLERCRESAQRILMPTASGSATGYTSQILQAPLGEVERVLAEVLESAPLIPVPYGQPCLILAPTGTWHLHVQEGNNWKQTAYLPLEVPEKVLLACGPVKMNPTAGSCVLASPLHDQYLHVGVGKPAMLLAFSVWHPELNDAEIAGFTAVLKAMGRFDAKYRLSTDS